MMTRRAFRRARSPETTRRPLGVYRLVGPALEIEMKKRMTVTQTCTVEIDRKKFNKQFMQEFRESFYNFTTIDEHICHLGQMYLRGIADNNSFIEGYGKTEEMGIRFTKPETQNLEVQP